ncbi:MAG: hypothetical protein WCG27_12435 [Pseudomonadota bacterium]
MKLFLVLIICLIGAGNCWAEYRIYQYMVKSKDFAKMNPQPYIVTATLDPISYLAYHGGPDSISIDLLRTWFCPGFTDVTSLICTAPGDENAQKPPSSETP